MISKILVPHDGSEMSNKAFENAVELAKMFKAELILLHVIEEIPIPPIAGIDLVSIDSANEIARRELIKGWDKLVEVKNHEIESVNVALRGECINGSAAEQILRFAINNKIDMIIMGSHRLKGLSKIKALGSVTRKVSESADCPVLIVH